MWVGPRRLAAARFAVFCVLLMFVPRARSAPTASWHGILRDASGHAVGDAAIVLRALSGDREYTAKTSVGGGFTFAEIVAGTYALQVTRAGDANATAPATGGGRYTQGTWNA